MAIGNYGLYKTSTGIIENIIVWDNENTDAIWPEGYSIILISDIVGTWSSCGIGWSYINGEFVEPPKPANYVEPEWPADRPALT
jgi:hypothetical protein